jgi:hypothetical protein
MWILSKLWKILILNEFSFIAIYASISSTIQPSLLVLSCDRYPKYLPFYGFHEGLIKTKMHF